MCHGTGRYCTCIEGIYKTSATTSENPNFEETLPCVVLRRTEELVVLSRPGCALSNETSARS